MKITCNKLPNDSLNAEPSTPFSDEFAGRPKPRDQRLGMPSLAK